MSVMANWGCTGCLSSNYQVEWAMHDEYFRLFDDQISCMDAPDWILAGSIVTLDLKVLTLPCVNIYHREWPRGRDHRGF